MTENAATSAPPAVDEVLPPAEDVDALAAAALPHAVTVPGYVLLLLAHGASLYANIIEGVRTGIVDDEQWFATFLEQGSALRLLELCTVSQEDLDAGLVGQGWAPGDEVYQTTNNLELSLSAAYEALGVKL